MTPADWTLQYMAGLVIIGAVVNIPAWLKLLAARWRHPDCRTSFLDPYLAIRTGMVLWGITNAATYLWFTVSAFQTGVVPLHPAWFYLSARVSMIAAEALFIWSAFLFGARRSLYWWIGLSALWTVGALAWGYLL